MKKLILLAVLMSLIQISSFSQCLPDGITFTTQEQIDNFQTDYPDCTVIEGNVEINGDSISNLTGLSSITTIMGDLIINGTYLTNLEGLENLLKIRRDLIIVSNDMLINLSGFESLDSICGNLTIGWNDLLPNLSGIDSINSESIQNLYIRENNSLQECHIQSICHYLISPNGTVLIFDNASGCNSKDEIESLCQTDIQDNSKSKYSIFPNPAMDVIYINIENNEPIEVISIYNQLGQIVLHFKQPTNQINTSYLQPGIYLIELVINDKIYREMLLIK